MDAMKVEAWSGVREATRRHPYASMVAACLACLALAVSISGWRSPGYAVARIATPETARPYVKDYERPSAVPFPANNEYTPAREALGKSLFFDPRLSGSNWISCASCHNPALSWGDGLPRAIGHGMKILKRRTPTILNVAWSDALFWDGRAGSLEEQALGPIQAPGEMNLDLDRMVAKISAIPAYRELFARGYPGEPIAKTTVGKAIATFERRIVSGTAPFDRWLGGDERAMTSEARHGFEVFNTKGHCSTCHAGWRFTDDSFHDIGVRSQDLGRGVILPSIEVMQYAFKTPTLRNIARRAPYMHDGSVVTLEDAVELYDRGGLAIRPSLAPEMKPLHLTAEDKRDVVAFLYALTSADTPVQIPTLPR